MKDSQYILSKIKDTVRQTDPDATVILFGSRARGDHKEDSDYDVLVLINKEQEKLTWPEKEPIAFPLYDLGVDTDSLISVKVYTKKGWANHRVTPFYENVNREGVVL